MVVGHFLPRVLSIWGQRGSIISTVLLGCTHVCLPVLLRHCNQLCQVTQFFQELLCIIVGAQVVSIPRSWEIAPVPHQEFRAPGNQGPDSSSTKLRLRNEKSSGSSDILRKTCREVATIEAVNRWVNKFQIFNG